MLCLNPLCSSPTTVWWEILMAARDFHCIKIWVNRFKHRANRFAHLLPKVQHMLLSFNWMKVKLKLKQVSETSGLSQESAVDNRWQSSRQRYRGAGMILLKSYTFGTFATRLNCPSSAKVLAFLSIWGHFSLFSHIYCYPQSTSCGTDHLYALLALKESPLQGGFTLARPR